MHVTIFVFVASYVQRIHNHLRLCVETQLPTHAHKLHHNLCTGNNANAYILVVTIGFFFVHPAFIFCGFQSGIPAMHIHDFQNALKFGSDRSR